MVMLRHWGRSLLAALGIALALLAGLHASQATDSAGDGEVATAAGAEDGNAAERGPAAYPVVSVLPVVRDVARTMTGFGSAGTDPRSLRAVTSANQIVITAVHVLRGEQVRRGQPLFTAEPDPAARLAYEQAQSAARLARHEVDRLMAQRADSLATESQVETAQKSLADANAAIEAARRQGAASDTTTLAAPADGVVTEIAVAAGDRPAVGTALARIATPGGLVIVGIEPGARRDVHAGDKATVRSVQGSGSPLAGHVVSVGAAVDPDSRLVSVAIRLDGAADGTLASGEAVEATIAVSTARAYVVPRAALLRDDHETYLYEIDAGKARRVPVRIVSDEGDRIAVSGELGSGRRVVTTGAYELEDGVAVEERRP
jgi:RND family efflux transporter MFP subunit